jgi:sigma-E factor negative regulatory protein RseA
MNEKISRLMDGELDDVELPSVLAGLKSPDALHTWTCYHAIGDALRRDASPRAFACGVSPAFGRRLSAEPTVIGPQRTAVERTAAWAWAAAATIAAVSIVGWTAFSLVDETPAAVAKAREAGSLRAAQVRQLAAIPSDYLVAHQEYSPSTALQVVGPYLRAAAVQGGDTRP